MNTPAEINDRRFSMSWNRGFTSHNLIRQEFNNSGAGSSTSYPQSEMIQMANGEFIGNSSLRMPVFKCPECSIVKNTSEELEVHKTYSKYLTDFTLDSCES
jgi:hypothetical protein